MLNKLEKALGYKFRDPELLRMALTHTSCANEIYQDPLRSYERLEFLGDSIVGFVTAEYLYRTFPKKLEGDLTRIRAELVCEKSLAAVAERLSLGEHLLLGNGEDQSGGRRRPSILCDVMEAVVAASYLDGGFAVARMACSSTTSSRFGTLSRISVSRIRRRSSQSGAQPLTVPNRMAMAVDSSVDRTPMVSEMRPPYQIMEKISRPIGSVPKRNSRDGASLQCARSR